jgi:hypothetical protein
MALIAKPINASSFEVKILSGTNFCTFDMKARVAMIAFNLSDSRRDRVGTEATLVLGHKQRARKRGLKVEYKSNQTCKMRVKKMV